MRPSRAATTPGGVSAAEAKIKKLEEQKNGLEL
jgi:hypothetical protein